MKKQRIGKYAALALAFVAGLSNVQAQQDPQYTQYMYNTSQVNPAYAGSRGVLSVFGLYRTQWVGLEGAPKTANVSLNTPLGDSRLGLGFSFANDRIGAMDENNISVDLSYAIDLNEDFQLSFGLKGTANLLNVDYSRLNHYNPNDVVFAENIENQLSPNVGAGLYLHSNQSYLGLSVPNFLNTNRYNDHVVSTVRQKMHFYLIGGHVFDFNPTWKFKPAFSVKAVAGAPLQVDLSANFMIADQFVVGAAYRWNAALSALVGFQINPGLFIGYSYDRETTKLSNYSSGSHEIFMCFELANRFNSMNNPRFF